MTTKQRYWGLLPPLPATALAEAAQQAEAMGLEGLWAIQLHGSAFLPLAGAAMVTIRLKLGTGVALAFTRSPLETACTALDLDLISGGRLVLGIGPTLRFFNEDSRIEKRTKERRNACHQNTTWSWLEADSAAPPLPKRWPRAARVSWNP